MHRLPPPYPNSCIFLNTKVIKPNVTSSIVPLRVDSLRPHQTDWYFLVLRRLDGSWFWLEGSLEGMSVPRSTSLQAKLVLLGFFFKKKTGLPSVFCGQTAAEMGRHNRQWPPPKNNRCPQPGGGGAAGLSLTERWGRIQGKRPLQQ